MENCVNPNKIVFKTSGSSIKNDVIPKAFQLPQEKKSAIIVHHTYSKMNGTKDSQCSVINNVNNSLKSFNYNLQKDNSNVILDGIKIYQSPNGNDGGSRVDLKKPRILFKQVLIPVIDLTTSSTDNTVSKLNKKVENSEVNSSKGQESSNFRPTILIPMKNRLSNLLAKESLSVQKPQPPPVKNVSSPSMASVKSIIDAWKVDFHRAYRNEYEDFDESRELEEIINQDKSSYQKLQEAKLIEERNATKVSFSQVKNDFTNNKVLVQELPEKTNRRKTPLECRLTKEHLDTLSIHTQWIKNVNNQTNHNSSYCNGNNRNDSNTNRLNGNDNESVITISDSDTETNDIPTKEPMEVSTPKTAKKKFKPASPLSPETTKRNEFYSYLKISTKPALRSDGTPVTPNRRSIRVRNLENKKRERSPSNDRSSSTSLTENRENHIQNKKSSNSANPISQNEIKKIFAKPKQQKNKQDDSPNHITDTKTKSAAKIIRNKEIATKQMLVRKFLTRRRSMMFLRSKIITKSNLNTIPKQKNKFDKKKKMLISKKNKKPIKEVSTKDFLGFTSKEQLDSKQFKIAWLQFYYNTEKIFNEFKAKRIIINLNTNDGDKVSSVCEESEKNKKFDQRLTNSCSDTKNNKKPSKYLNKSKQTPNRFNGITTRSTSLIHRIITRSSQAKLRKFNFNSVLDRIKNKKFLISSNDKSNFKKSNLPNRSKSSTLSVELENGASDDESLETEQENSSFLNGTTEENASSLIQDNVTVRHQDDRRSNALSSDFEDDFYGFDTQSVKTLTGNGNENEMDNSDLLSLRWDLIKRKRRYSLPSYIGEEKTANLISLLSKESKSKNTDPEIQLIQNPFPQIISTENNTIQFPDLFHIDTIDQQSQPPTFIPLISQTNRSFNQTFFNTKPHLAKPTSPCIFGTGETSQYSSIWEEDSLQQNSLTVHSSILEQDNLSFLSKSDQKHAIDINQIQGNVISMQFVANTLIVVQESLISFWQQTPLGTILGAQNMWLCLGKVQRLKLDQGCEIKKTHSRNVISVENAIAYTELWIKEHSSERRVVTVSDIFVVIYFYFYNKKGPSGIEKKVLQLENIKGYAQDVQYITIENNRSILACWRDHYGDPLKSMLRRYMFAPDFQTVTTVAALESVNHYIISLHNVLDCQDMVIGIGHQCVSVWHIPYGKLITTVELIQTVEYPTVAPFSDINCVWALCDRGFLFLLQKTENNHLQLIAINGLRNDWKQLKLYRVPSEYTNLRGVSIEGGVLCACYENGLVCWTLQTGALLLQCPSGDHISVYPSQSHILFIDQTFNVGAKHITAFLLLLSCRLA